MASLLNQLSLVFLLFLASSSFQIHARESRFLEKATRPEDTKEATPISQETPAVKMEDPSTLTPLRSLSGSGYGLYGHDQEQFATATTTNYNNNNYRYNNARPNTELASENYENRYNGGYNYANQFKYGYHRPSKSSNEEFNRGSYETQGYNNNVDPNKQYGLSDTRFLENGRYFYDVNAERTRDFGRQPTRGNYENGVYGNGNANYAYNNPAERRWYQNNQVNQENQEEYVP
uniref:Protein E6 n=1 Tax=Elaeis guineensis var. tenera TaxID=51953 RepID=A0A6I9RK27_ELAGV|nr:protein E6 [Elaeis guineensis]